MNNLMYFLINFALLFATWIVFSGKFDLFHLLLGGFSCLLVALLTTDLLFQDRSKSISSRFKEGLRFISYTGWLMHQVVLANFHVIKLALSPKAMEQELDPFIFKFKTQLTSEFAKFIFANSITLTPGTVTIRIHKDVFYVHAISKKAVGDLAEDNAMSEMEKRIAWVFEGGSI